MGSKTTTTTPVTASFDVDDWDPTSPAESADNDGDGWGNNADYDDDNDGIADESDDDMDGDGFDNVDETTNCVSGLSDLRTRPAHLLIWMATGSATTWTSTRRRRDQQHRSG